MEPINVLLVCMAGLSTDLVVDKLKKYINNKGLDISFEALSINSAPIHDLIENRDILLLAPQIRYKFDQIVEELSNTDVKVAIIPFQDYGLANVQKIIEIIYRLNP